MFHVLIWNKFFSQKYVWFLYVKLIYLNQCTHGKTIFLFSSLEKWVSKNFNIKGNLDFLGFNLILLPKWNKNGLFAVSFFIYFFFKPFITTTWEDWPHSPVPDTQNSSCPLATQNTQLGVPPSSRSLNRPSSLTNSHNCIIKYNFGPWWILRFSPSLSFPPSTFLSLFPTRPPAQFRSFQFLIVPGTHCFLSFLPCFSY